MKTRYNNIALFGKLLPLNDVRMKYLNTAPICEVTPADGLEGLAHHNSLPSSANVPTYRK